MYTHSAAGCWQGPTSSSSIPKPTGHSPPSPVSRVPGRKLSPQPVPAAPGGPACAVRVQQGWAGDGSVLPGRDFLLLLPGSPFICPELMAELLPSPVPPSACAMSCVCCRPHLSLSVGPASHLVPSPPSALWWKWDVAVPSKAADTQRHRSGYEKVLVARGQENLGCPATGTCSHLWPVWELPWTPGCC